MAHISISPMETMRRRGIFPLHVSGWGSTWVIFTVSLPCQRGGCSCMGDYDINKCININIAYIVLYIYIYIYIYICSGDIWIYIYIYILHYIYIYNVYFIQYNIHISISYRTVPSTTWPVSHILLTEITAKHEKRGKYWPYRAR